MGRESFVLYTKINEVVQKLTDEQKGKVFQAILDYEETGEQPAFDDLMLELVFVPIRQDLDKCNEKWEAQIKARVEAGRKGGLANQAKLRAEKSESSKSSKAKQCLKDDEANQANQADNVNGNENVNGNGNGNENANDNNNPPKSPQGDGEKEPSLQERRFEEFWSVYPKKVGKANAWKEWQKLKPTEELFEKIMQSVHEHIERDQDFKRGYIVHPERYLKNRRWEDVLPEQPQERKRTVYDEWMEA